MGFGCWVRACFYPTPKTHHPSPLLIIRAGLPATTAPAGTLLVTTAPAPTTARSPISTPQRMVALLPMEAPRRTTVGSSVQSASVCGVPSGRVARGQSVVDEHHAVADEDLVLDRHALADEGVA